ncbi:hypothetical protein UlMin_031268 [Ulmus minor]
MNRALLAKWCWSLISGHTSLCLSLLRGKYLRDTSFQCVLAKPTDSLLWKSPGVIVVADLLGPNGNWDVRKLHASFSPADCVLIQSIHRPRNPGFDRWIWTLLASGEFSTKSAYWLDQETRFELRRCWDKHSWNMIWSSQLLPRHKLMWWQCLLGVLPSRTRLAWLFHIANLLCPLCGTAEESTKHLFFYCPMAAQFWLTSRWNLNTQANPGKPVFDWFGELWRIKDLLIDKDVMLCFAACLMDIIWKTENEITHGALVPSYTVISSRLNVLFLLSWSSLRKSLPIGLLLGWRR